MVELNNKAQNEIVEALKSDDLGEDESWVEVALGL
jgi:hypothetical protein